ncbi:MAG: hypothetical protein PQJ58_05060 [Spirochaetales bacterium]|nr:hypothetical protein [Spirochaetales bacterium]
MKKKKSNKSHISRSDRPVIKSVLCEKVIPGGDGLVRVDGKVVFIPSLLAGERADIELVSEGKKFSRGRVLQLHETSPRRVTPFCNFYERCGGCNLQHTDYEHQIELKTSFIKEHFRKFAGIELPDTFRFFTSRPEAYRNRVQFHKTSEGCGFKKRGSDSVIRLKSCPVLVKGLDSFLGSGQSIINDREIFFGTDETCYSGRERELIEVIIKDRSVRFRSDLFFQSNLSLLPALIDYVTDFAETHTVTKEHAMDLYCGVGLFSVFLKDTFSSLTGIELNRETESFYRSNMEGSDYDFFGESLEQWLLSGKRRPSDFIVVDPPRTGLSPEVRQYLIDMRVPALVYVSCDPVTQARDTKELICGGYVLDSGAGFDFYPQTHHMESVLRFVFR